MPRPMQRLEARVLDAEGSVLAAAIAERRKHTARRDDCRCRLCRNVDEYIAAVREWSAAGGKLPEHRPRIEDREGGTPS